MWIRPRSPRQVSRVSRSWKTGYALQLSRATDAIFRAADRDHGARDGRAGAAQRPGGSAAMHPSSAPSMPLTGPSSQWGAARGRFRQRFGAHSTSAIADAGSRAAGSGLRTRTMCVTGPMGAKRASATACCSAGIITDWCMKGDGDLNGGGGDARCSTTRGAECTSMGGSRGCGMRTTWRSQRRRPPEEGMVPDGRTGPGGRIDGKRRT